MGKLDTSIKLLVNQRSVFWGRVLEYCGGFITNDKLYLKCLFRCKMGYWPNLSFPQNFNEKIQWLKLNNQKPEYTTMVDKFSVKSYVASIIGNEYIIPTIGFWDSPEQIEWDLLPSKFVLKTTNGGGSCGVVICKDKENFDKKRAITVLKASLKDDIYRRLREYPYRDVKKRIIAEELLEDSTTTGLSSLTDYKFYCFNGDPLYCQVIKDRQSNETIDFFDKQWNRMPFIGFTPTATHSLDPIEKPFNYELMKEIAKKLSSGIPFVRIDLYSIGTCVFFGEITFFPNSGFGHLSPKEWGTILGDQLVLPSAQ